MKKLAILLLVIVVITNFSSLKAQNLILNPGCEDSLINGEIPYWTEVIGTNWTYRASGDPPSYEGDYMFFPGVVAKGELAQDIDVSSKSSSIDSSIQYFYFESYVRAYNQNPPDHSRIVLEYLDTLKITKLDSIDLGEYFNINEWVKLTDTTLAPVGTRFIRIRLISTRYNGSNNDGYYDGLSLIGTLPTSISSNAITIPEKFILTQNYPNPFNPTTKISFAIPQNAFVELIVFNLLGQEIVTLVNQEKPAGTYEVDWNAANLPSGVYFYRLQAGDYVQTRKMILLK